MLVGEAYAAVRISMQSLRPDLRAVAPDERGRSRGGMPRVPVERGSAPAIVICDGRVRDGRPPVHLSEVMRAGRARRSAVAEEEGFEPPCESPRKRFSRPPVSTTHPFLRDHPYYSDARPAIRRSSFPFTSWIALRSSSCC